MTKTKKNNLVKKVLGGIAIVLGLFTGVWAVDAHFVTKEYHKLCMQQVNQTIQGIQKQTAIQSVYDKLYYWQKMEMEISALLLKYPGNQNLQAKLRKVLKEIEKAEEELKRLLGGQ